jgi:hypothetical protein
LSLDETATRAWEKIFENGHFIRPGTGQEHVEESYRQSWNYLDEQTFLS